MNKKSSGDVNKNVNSPCDCLRSQLLIAFKNPKISRFVIEKNSFLKRHFSKFRFTSTQGAPKSNWPYIKYFIVEEERNSVKTELGKPGVLIRFYFTPPRSSCSIYKEWAGDPLTNAIHPPEDQKMWYKYYSVVKAVYRAVKKDKGQWQAVGSDCEETQIWFKTAKDLVDFLLSEDGKKYLSWCNQKKVI